MKRLLLWVLILLSGASSAFADTWVNLSEFKDKTFQTYLKTVYKTKLSSDQTQINVEQIYYVAINGETYRAISSLEGIKKLINLRALYLPGKSSSNKAFSLKTLDVSGMRNLEMIDNGSYVSYSYNTTTHTPSGSASSGNSSKCVIEAVIAEDCPKLKYVALAKYTSLKSISLKGSENVEALYIGANTALTSIDISGLPKIKNMLKAGSAQGATGTLTSNLYSSTSVNKVPNFAFSGCTAMKEVILGEHPEIEHLTINTCAAIETLDISGMTGLKSFEFEVNSTISSTGSEPRRGAGLLSDLVLAENYPAMEYFCVRQTNLRHIDINPFAKTVYQCMVEGCYITEFPITALTRATTIKLGNNCIYSLDLPNKACKIFHYRGNRMTWMPWPGTDANTNKLTHDSNPMDYNPQVRNVPEGTMVYKVFDDPEFIEHIMMTDDVNSQKAAYFAPQGGHFGVKEEGEDPCCFYFDYPDMDGVYFFNFPVSLPTTSSTYRSRAYVQVTLHHGFDAIDEEYHGPAHEFYLTGDFNNWTTSEKYKFVYEGEGKYSLATDLFLMGCFRVINSSTRQEATLDFGGHHTETLSSGDPHVQVIPQKQHKLGEDAEMHYATTPTGEKTKAIVNPEFEMLYLPSHAQNYLKINGDMTTGVESVIFDNSDAPVEYFNLQGVKCGATTPGIYLRRQGAKVEKVVVR